MTTLDLLALSLSVMQLLGTSTAVEIKPISIQRMGSAGAAISCSHFRARLRDDLRASRELAWNLETRVDPRQLQTYFRHRLAADPYDVAGQRIADIKWLLPKAAFPPAAQVFGFLELTREDFSGEQMHFEVPGRAVEIGETSVEIRSPVRMIDVCLNGFVDLKVYSECPINEIRQWGSTPDDSAGVPTIHYPDCKRADTYRLSLAGVEQALANEKTFLTPESGEKGFPISEPPGPCDTQAVKAARLLDNLVPIRRLHNCTIDVVRRPTGELVEYSIYARDEQTCKNNPAECLEGVVTLAAPASCMSGYEGVSPSIRFSSGANRGGTEFTAQLNAQLNRSGQLQELSIRHYDRKSGRDEDHVFCHAN